ncbi:hypothetical protein B0H16DRAFT_1470908 [Mycena metata]|uniref:Uncharacterized protein n=1 Tax=Mycena metata TaxID=1033252 RepID=A0AAD7HSS2_9AGAR|nr:hypothetical protein B0H16DRAFT_1470908 [Mycena metata]
MYDPNTNVGQDCVNRDQTQAPYVNNLDASGLFSKADTPMVKLSVLDNLRFGAYCHNGVHTTRRARGTLFSRTCMIETQNSMQPQELVATYRPGSTVQPDICPADTVHFYTVNDSTIASTMQSATEPSTVPFFLSRSYGHINLLLYYLANQTVRCTCIRLHGRRYHMIFNPSRYVEVFPSAAHFIGADADYLYTTSAADSSTRGSRTM